MSEQRLWIEFSEPKVGDDCRLRHRLYQLGEWVHEYHGPFTITEDTHKEIVANFSLPVNLNYDHEDLGISAGKIVEIEPELDADGFAWGVSVLTPRAKDRVNEGEYRGFSAQVQWKSKDEKGRKRTGAYMDGGALTNIPFFRTDFDIERLAAMRTALLSDLRSEFARLTNKAAFAATGGGMPIDTLKGKLNPDGSYSITLPAGFTLPDGTKLDAPMDVPLEIEGMEAEAEMGKKTPEEEAAMAAAQTRLAAAEAELETAKRELTELRASRVGQSGEIAALHASVASMKAELARQQAAANEAKADAYLAEMRVAPSARDEIREVYLSQGPAKADKWLSILGAVGVVPDGELGRGDDPARKTPASQFETVLAEFKRAHPDMRELDAVAQLSRQHPKSYAAWANQPLGE